MKKVLVCILNYYQEDYVVDLIMNILEKSPQTSFYFSIGDIQPCNNFLYDKLINIKEDRFKYSYTSFNYNPGYAKGNNELIKHASKDNHFEYILISNPDIEVKDYNIINKMIADLEANENYAVVGPKVVEVNGRQAGPYLKQTPYIYGLKHLFPVAWAPFWFIREGRIKKISKVTSVWRIIGAFFLIKHDYFNKIGYFDENTFLYWEEDILSSNLQKLGKKTLYDPTIEVVHLNNGKGTKKISEYSINSMNYYFKLCNYSRFSIIFCNTCIKFYNKILHVKGNILSRED